MLFPYRPCRKLTDRAPENSESQLVIHRVLALGFPLRLSSTYHTVVARLKLQLPEVFPRMPKAESHSQTENVTTAQQAMKGSSCCRGIGSPPCRPVIVGAQAFTAFLFFPWSSYTARAARKAESACCDEFQLVVGYELSLVAGGPTALPLTSAGTAPTPPIFLLS